MLAAFLGIGIYFTIATRGFQVRCFPIWMRKTLGSCLEKELDESTGGMSRFQALCTSLAATIGTGNIAGVATALVAGGPGALFWMWVSAFLGMMTGFAEKLLGHVYRYPQKDGTYMGGAMVTMERGLGSRGMGMLYAGLCLGASFGMGNLIQANSIAQAANAAWGISPMILAPFLAGLVYYCTKSGKGSIGRVSEILVPFMSVIYLTGAIIVLIHFRERIPEAIHLVFGDVFSWRAITFGVARGVFSNEAGLGTSVIAHAQSDVKEPVEQGMWGILEVFLDTIVMCTITGLVILVSGVYDGGADGAVMTLQAFSAVFGSRGEGFLTVSIFLFALSTLIGWYFFGTQCVLYLCPESGSQYILPVFRTVFYSMILIGALGQLQTVWRISDFCNNMLAIPNLLCLLMLRKEVIFRTKQYLMKKELFYF